MVRAPPVAADTTTTRASGGGVTRISAGTAVLTRRVAPNVAVSATIESPAGVHTGSAYQAGSADSRTGAPRPSAGAFHRCPPVSSHVT